MDGLPRGDFPQNSKKIPRAPRIWEKPGWPATGLWLIFIDRSKAFIAILEGVSMPVYRVVISLNTPRNFVGPFEACR